MSSPSFLRPRRRNAADQRSIFYVPPAPCPPSPPPQELINAGLYDALAIACFPGLHHEVRSPGGTFATAPASEATDLAPPVSQVSLVLLAKALGATPVSARSSIRDSLSNIGRFTTAPRGSTTSDPVVTEEDSQLEQVLEVEPVV